MSRLNNKGFTILELLIATMVFSVIFLSATTAIIQIGKLYYKGVVSGRTQETTRTIADSISQQLQFSYDGLTIGANKIYPVTKVTPVGTITNQTFKSYCIGTTRYSYVLNRQVSDKNVGKIDVAALRLSHALWRDTITTGALCGAANLGAADPSMGTGGSNGSELLAVNMRLSQFSLNCDAVTHLCTLNLGVIYGDNDLLTPVPTVAPPTQCASIIGSQWCATSNLTTSVFKRVGVN